MRAYLKIKATSEVLPYNHLPLLTGSIHKWLGWNKEHGNVSLYSFSQLEGGLATKEGLRFAEGATMFFSAHNPDLIKALINGVQSSPSMFYGLTVDEILLQDDPDLSNRTLFYNASPVFVKRKNGDRVEHILYDDERAGAFLEETLKTKMGLVGLIDETLSIKFDRAYTKASSKLIDYNGVKNRCSWCSLNIEGKPETKLFAWNVGLGNSTGIGFGAIK